MTSRRFATDRRTVFHADEQYSELNRQTIYPAKDDSGSGDNVQLNILLDTVLRRALNDLR